MMSVREAATAIGAAHRGPDARFERVGSDSRAVLEGDLFVALTGERFDGHDFVDAARDSGAVAAMVGRDAAQEFSDPRFPLMVVSDTRRGLGDLAAHWRGRFRIPLVALTGSNGKTTVKEMLAGILREAAGGPEAVLATEGNLNNDIGVPLMLLRLRERHRYAVIEMGMSHTGEIAYLARLARPDVAIVTNAGSAHMEFLGTREAIARAKGEIFEALAPGGTAVINADDAFAPLWRDLVRDHPVIEFGLEHPAGVNARYRLGSEVTQLRVQLPAGSIDTTLRVPGLHNVRNALAAAAAAAALKVAPAAIAAGLSGFTGVKGRLQRKPGPNGAVMIDDTYNANPESVEAGLAVLAAVEGMRVLVLGDMGELGSHAPQLHARIGERARAAGVDRLLALGEASRAAVAAFGAGARHFEQVEQLLTELEGLLAPGVTVLVKGSRFMRMERIVNGFDAARAGCAATGA
jgi:UDP-N-acetylmuramoyl-tripeptide--D-alanyl-D-alanine ligase